MIAMSRDHHSLFNFGVNQFSSMKLAKNMHMKHQEETAKSALNYCKQKS